MTNRTGDHDTREALVEINRSMANELSAYPPAWEDSDRHAAAS
jgi:hypothetical protein